MPKLRMFLPPEGRTVATVLPTKLVGALEKTSLVRRPPPVALVGDLYK